MMTPWGQCTPSYLCPIEQWGGWGGGYVMKMKRLFDYQENIDVVGGGIKKMDYKNSKCDS